MADFINVTEPAITETRWTPHPTPKGTKAVFAAKITEKVIKTLYPTPFSAGEISAGED